MARTALIIDDSFIMRARIQTILKEAGYDVVDARTGREGLEKLQENSIDLILVDWHMPEMSGIEFVKALREDPGFGEIPVMMVTAEVEEEMVKMAMDAGVNAYVTKPFKKEEIFEKIENL